MQNGTRDWTVGDTSVHWSTGSFMTLLQSYEGENIDGVPTRFGVSMSIDISDLAELRDAINDILAMESERGK